MAASTKMVGLMPSGPVNGSDYLFTWKPGMWPHERLRSVVDRFHLHGTAHEQWRCLAHRKIKVGDRAYLLKQSDPLGIFGRGIVVGKPIKRTDVPHGENPGTVLIRFDALVDPLEHLLVDETQPSNLAAPQSRWRTQASGITLEAEAAREIDRMINSDLSATATCAEVREGTAREIERQKRLGEQATRPGQQAFGLQIRANYRNRCALTGCVTAASLQAAHIRVQKHIDDNSPANGLLLRSDIHALFDALLITLSEDGKSVEISPDLTDPTYNFLRSVSVNQPVNAPPSPENIREHRKRFLARRQSGSGKRG
jgi:HNH endonuclease